MDNCKKSFIIRCRYFVGLLLAMCLTLSMTAPAYAEGTEQLTTTVTDANALKRAAKQYTYDYTTNAGNWAVDEKTGEFCGTWKNLPMLFSGDEVTIIPNVPNTSGVDHDGQCATGYVGMVFNNPDSAASRGPIEVTKVNSYGQTSESHGNSFIQGFKITGDEPVMVYSGGGGGYTNEKVEHPVYSGISLAYYAASLSYNTFPNYCNINVQYADTDAGKELTEAEVASEIHYYTTDKNPTKITYQDAFHNYDLNYDETKDLIYYNVLHPYMEGYGIQRVVIVAGTNNYTYKWLNYSFDREADSWKLIPQWRNFGRSGEPYVMQGSYDDTFTIRYEFSGKRTVTLDACGGTVEGYASKIYDLSGNTQFGKWVASAEAGEFTPKRTGYIFKGWYEDPEYTTEVTSFSETASKYTDNPYDERANRVCRMYAKWEKEVTISPVATKVTKLTKGKKKLTVTWAKQTSEGTAGYQIQYGTNKSFKAGTYKTITIKGNATTKKTVSKLKSKKKYYVRVRTYCVINDENVYSAWSASKNVKVK